MSSRKDSRVSGILFDKDGTLLDFNGTWLKPYLEASDYLANLADKPELADHLMRSGGYHAETESWQSDSLLASASNGQIFEYWQSQLGFKLSDTQIHHIQSIFSHAANEYVPAIDNLSEFLQTLRSRGLRLGLATMDDASNAESMLGQLGLRQYFDFVCGADSGFGVKPDPGMVDAFCQKCALVNSDIYMVGDSPKDLNMGKNAGVYKSIGVLTGAYNNAELVKFADIVLADICGILELV